MKEYKEPYLGKHIGRLKFEDDGYIGRHAKKVPFNIGGRYPPRPAPVPQTELYNKIGNAKERNWI